MNGQEIFDGITNISYNKAVFHFASFLKDEENLETLKVGIELLTSAQDLLLVASDAESLRNAILTQASITGSFAGMKVGEESGGLNWVAFSDLWDGLEYVVKETAI